MTTRTLSVMFTDIVGSTELLTKVGRTTSERLLSGHFEDLRCEIERRRGRLVKTLGDGLMATFDAARDALDCAVAIQQLCDGSSGGSNHALLSIRIGVSTGDVSVDHADCFGRAVVEASRLCDRARGGQVLFAESTRLLSPDYTPITALGELRLKGLPESGAVWEARWSRNVLPPLRVVLADDVVLMREGIAHVLEAAGIEIVGQAGDGMELLRLTAETRPNVAIVDVRMPPTHTDEGLRAAEEILAGYSTTGVLVLSQEVQPRHEARLRAARPTGVGYLLKDRVADLRDFAAATRRVAAGGTAFESGDLHAEAPGI